MAKNIMSVFGAHSGRAAGASDSSSSSDAEASAMSVPGASGASARSVMTLGRTLSFKGELAADEDLVLLGRVEGTISHTASVTVGAGGVVIGDIRACFITVKGTVEGDLEATESIVIAPTANVIGDLAAPRVGIVEGARFVGAVKMTSAPLSDAWKADAPPSDSPAGEGIVNDKAADRILGG